ncbi:putative chloride channel protein [Diaporthe ampelina]|uniref:Chloride channel protein n=1 Tax=Diaporthe ampelina TaxID=1214573 RepID=A0A0G2FYL1_9PEZI|nr:putative chloride channel protein [Diaporthe ampelina]
MNDGLANGEASSSSSSQSPQHGSSRAVPHGEEDDPARRPGTADSDLLGDDPLSQDLAEPISFKRKQKRPGAGLGLLTNLTGSLLDQRGGNRSHAHAGADRLQGEEPDEAPYPEIYHSSPRRRGGPANNNNNNTTTAHTGSTPKDGAPLDWHVEGPGQRVGYENLTAIDWIFEYTKERARLRVLHSNAVGLVGYAQRLLDASQEWVILVLTGLLVGSLAAAIDIVSDWLGDLKAGYCSTADGGAFYLNKNFCCLGYDEGAHVLVKEYSVYARHSGIPEIKTVLGGFVIRRFLGTWTLVTKSLGLQISYYFPDKTMWKSFVCAMTAAVVLKALDPFRTGETALYHVKYSTEWHNFEAVGPFLVLGFLGGIYGGLFIKLNMKVASWKKARVIAKEWLPGPITQVAIVSLLTALINYPNLYMRAQSSELVANLFSECSKLLDDQFGLCKTGAATAGTIVLLLFAAVLGFFLAAITFGLQIPAGIILPSMAIGALSGRAIGIIMEIWVHNHPGFIAFQQCEPDIPCINPGTYAIIGAASTLAGVTRMTVSIVVIMFELTGALTYVLPIMIAVMISKWVGDAFGRRGIYESWIHFNEYPFLDNSDENVASIPDIPAGQVMTRIEDLVVLTAAGHTIASLRAILETQPYRGFPVVSDPRDAMLLGYISRAELQYNLAGASRPPRSLPPEAEAFFSHQPLADPRTTLDLRPWVDQTPITLPSRASLHLAVSYFQKIGLRYVLFSDRGVLQGLLTKKDVWQVLNGAEETRRTGGAAGGGGGLSGNAGVETGITREEGEGEQRGLLERAGLVDEAPSPGAEVDSIL